MRITNDAALGHFLIPALLMAFVLVIWLRFESRESLFYETESFSP